MSDTNTLRNRIASELQFPLTNSFGLTSETFATAVNRCINDAIAHYESTRFRFNERKGFDFATGVAGTRSYSLPADFISMDSLKVKYADSQLLLDKCSWEELDAKDTQISGNSRGIPCEYAIGGNVVKLWPIPNSVTMTFQASYIRRFLPTSVTGSYTAVMPMAGSYSLTVTTTASHNNRLNGWTTDAKDLIRARAVADIKINYRRNPVAIREMQQLFASREAFLSIHERQAFERLADETFDAVSTGRIEPYRL